MCIYALKKKDLTHVFANTSCLRLSSPYGAWCAGSALPISRHGSSYSASALAEHVYSADTEKRDEPEYANRKKEK
jgi:hypothetical protein